MIMLGDYMASRMEKYHSNTSSVGTRSVKNENLYRDMYENVEYSNIERVATMEKTNEISLEQIQELLREREAIKKKNSTVKKEIPKINRPVEERNYDIRDVLVKAKDEHIEDNKNRSLRNTQYNILKNINIKNNSYNDEKIENTLVNTGVLKNYDDNELSLDMLSDLKSTGNTLVNKTNTALLLKEVQEAKDRYQDNNDDGLDRSFYTSSLNFKEDDFEQLKDLQDSIDSNNKMIKILFLLLFIITIGVVAFVVLRII